MRDRGRRKLLGRPLWEDGPSDVPGVIEVFGQHFGDLSRGGTARFREGVLRQLALTLDELEADLVA